MLPSGCQTSWTRPDIVIGSKASGDRLWQCICHTPNSRSGGGWSAKVRSTSAAVRQHDRRDDAGVHLPLTEVVRVEVEQDVARVRSQGPGPLGVEPLPFLFDREVLGAGVPGAPAQAFLRGPAVVVGFE